MADLDLLKTVEAALERSAFPGAQRVLQAMREGPAGDADASLRAAEACQRLGSGELARKVPETARRLDPAGPDVLAACAQFYAGSRQWNEAGALWRAMRDAFPGDRRGHVGGALVLRRLQAFADADAVLTGAAQRFPDDLEIAVMLAENCADLDQRERCVGVCRTILAEHPDTPPAHVRVARIHERLGSGDEASRILTAAHERFPGNPDILAEHAELWMRAQHWEKADELWRTLRAAFPDDRRGYARGAFVLRRRGFVRRAHLVLEQGFKRFPDDLNVAATLAENSADLESRNRAGAVCERILECHADNPKAHVRVAHVYRRLGILRRAEAVLDAARTRFPKDADVLAASADVYMRLRQWERAGALLAELRNRFPDMPGGYLRGAVALRQSGRHEDAHALLAASRQRFPDDVNLAILFAENCADLKRFEQAYAVCRDLRHSHPDDPVTCLRGADLLVALGHAGEALELLRRACRSGRDPRFLIRLARLEWFEGGSREAALAALEKAQSLGLGAAHWSDVTDLYIVMDEAERAVQCLTAASRETSRHGGDLRESLRRARLAEAIHQNTKMREVATSRDLLDIRGIDKATARVAALSCHRRLRTRYICAAYHNLRTFNFAKARKLHELIIEKVRNREPFSFIRLGDGEASVLIGKDDDMLGSARLLFNDEKVRLGADELARLNAELRLSIGRCDVLGMPDEMYPAGFQVMWPALEQEITRPQNENQIIVSCHDHYSLLETGLFDELFEGGHVTAILGPTNPKAMEIARHRPPRYFPIPGQRLRRDHHRTCRYPHYPNFYDRLRTALGRLGPGDVVLVGAGVLGKIYCDWIRQAGAVALDVGALMDLWGGLTDTRDFIKANYKRRGNVRSRTAAVERVSPAARGE